MKSKKFVTAYRNAGGYVHVFMRDDERPMLDLNFFEGDRNLAEAKALRDILDKSIACAEQFIIDAKAERTPPRRRPHG